MEDNNSPGNFSDTSEKEEEKSPANNLNQYITLTQATFLTIQLRLSILELHQYRIELQSFCQLNPNHEEVPKYTIIIKETRDKITQAQKQLSEIMAFMNKSSERIKFLQTLNIPNYLIHPIIDGLDSNPKGPDENKG